jgi:hypothetical protein
MPERIQLRRTKGWRMPAGAVKVDRSTRWGNPFRIGDPVGDEIASDYHLSAEQAAREFRFWLDGLPTVRSNMPSPPSKADIRTALRGKSLACWCKPGEPCHADVLLEIANA